MKEHHILIVDDDEKLRELLIKFFEGYNLETTALPDGDFAASTAIKIRPDIVILDLMMPGKDGFQVLREIRERSQVPIIMLTAKGDDSDKIVGLELGADDYLSKPFNPRELLARIRAILRRQGTQQPPQPQEKLIEAGGLALDAMRHVLIIEGDEHPLSTAEFDMLKAFMTNVDMILSRDRLLSLARGDDCNSYDRTVDVHVSKLRNILKRYPAHESRIKTIWGEGYRFLGEQ